MRLVALAFALIGTSVLADTSIPSLNDLSLDALRARSYDSSLTLAADIDCPGRSEGAVSQMLSYTSDGLSLYARAEVPTTPMPEGGYPVLIFAHGWIGIDGAPEYPFACNADAYYGPLVNAYADAGYVVLIPGYRGHGTVNGKPADGIDWMATWDNGTYLSPVFYAVDVLNILAAAPSFDALNLPAPGGTARIDLSQIHVLGHSQGGDVAAIVLGSVGGDAANGLTVASGSLWSGCYVDRFTQLATYGPMETAVQAFTAGDGSWNGTATGADGRVNPGFVFGYPPNWIGTTDQSLWDWQKDYWTAPSTRAAVEAKLTEMYDTLNAKVADSPGYAYSIEDLADGGFEVVHDPKLAEQMRAIGVFDLADRVSVPISVHSSDRDFYSFASWNSDFCDRVNAAGGTCRDFVYPANTHELQAAAEEWFSPPGTVPGFPLMVARDQALFDGGDPASVN